MGLGYLVSCFVGGGGWMLICVGIGISWRIRRMTDSSTMMPLYPPRMVLARRSCTALSASPTREKSRLLAHSRERKPDTLELRTTSTSATRRQGYFLSNEVAVNIWEEARVPCSDESLPRRTWTWSPWPRLSTWRSSCHRRFLCRRPSVKLRRGSVSHQGRG